MWQKASHLDVSVNVHFDNAVLKRLVNLVLL